MDGYFAPVPSVAPPAKRCSVEVQATAPSQAPSVPPKRPLHGALPSSFSRARRWRSRSPPRPPRRAGCSACRRRGWRTATSWCARGSPCTRGRESSTPTPSPRPPSTAASRLRGSGRRPAPRSSCSASARARTIAGYGRPSPSARTRRPRSSRPPTASTAGACLCAGSHGYLQFWPLDPCCCVT
jgi:hypothetical protein